VSLRPPASEIRIRLVRKGEVAMSQLSRRRCIGLDVRRDFAQVAIWQGGVVSQAGRFATTPEGVRALPRTSDLWMRWRWRRPGTRARSRRCWPATPVGWWCPIRSRRERSPRRRSKTDPLTQPVGWSFERCVRRSAVLARFRPPGSGRGGVRRARWYRTRCSRVPGSRCIAGPRTGHRRASAGGGVP
jgi:hypothetical protein